MFTFEGREYIERNSVKKEALADFRARMAFGDSIADAIDAAYSNGLEKDKRLDTLRSLSEALNEERKRISEELYEMQGAVSQFASTKECIAYNRALREAAEKINRLIGGN